MLTANLTKQESDKWDTTEATSHLPKCFAAWRR